MKAIETKYLGATNTKPSRFKAIADGKTMIFSYDYEYSYEDNHKHAAHVLAIEQGWLGDGTDLFTGQMKNGNYVHVLH